jgi:hypothetical protein
LLSLTLAGCATLKVRIDHRAEDMQVRKDRDFASSEAARHIAAGDAAALFNQAQDLPWEEERRPALLLASARAIIASGELSDEAQRLYNGAIRQIVATLGAGGIKDHAIRGAKSPLLTSILKLPMSRSVPYHSIVGDRGKGNSPNSTDGVVAYWSSHLEGAASEKIVSSGHGAIENPEGIAEIRRILIESLTQQENQLIAAAKRSPR